METGRNFSMSEINSRHYNLPTYEMSLKSDNVEFVRMVAATLKMATGRNFSMSGINSEHHYLPTYQILPPIFLCRVLAAILKMADILKILKRQNCSSDGDLSMCQKVCLYY